MGLDVMPLRLRLLRVEPESGQIEVLITSLTDEKYSRWKSSRIYTINVGLSKLTTYS